MIQVAGSFCTKWLLDAAKAYRQAVDDHCQAAETLIAAQFTQLTSHRLDEVTFRQAQSALETSSLQLTKTRFKLDCIVELFNTLATDENESAQRLVAEFERLHANIQALRAK